MNAEAHNAEAKMKKPSKEESDTIIRYHVWASIGVGLIPMPLIDIVALTAVQLHLLKKIAESYGVPFFRDKVKNILSALAGGYLPGMISASVASMAKAVPLAGQTIGAAAMPVIAGAATYAVGKVFVQHFASGGTFLTFDPEEVWAYYADMFEEGKKIAGDGENIAADMESEK